MTRYGHVFESFDKEDGAIEIPDEAVGITVDTFSHLATVHYLVPVEDGDSA